EATHNLLQNVTSGTINTKNSWAWLQLGLSYLEQEDNSNAIDNLRSVVRIQPKNVHCWEALADAYLIRGSYTSAQKCYEKSLELVDNILYPLFQIANIKKILGHFAEAQVNFEEILLSNEHYVPALKGFAETCIYQAKECYKDQRLGTARNYAQLALEKLILAIQQRSDMSCLWKLLADNCLFVAKLPNKYCHMLIPIFFLEHEELEGTTVAESQDLYIVASSFEFPANSTHMLTLMQFRIKTM
ncbi:tetratricopeptide repeat protein 37, partial [Anoplophora glabripennis]|uniref:tetratricopeptide repeat protein 37 n=1 Tax=Anoplophora glabripennis TaxID=217634 RepID=UPI0008739871